MKLNIKKYDVVSIVKRHAIVSIIASIFMIAVGVLLCIAPGYTSAIIIWITLGFIALGGLFGVLKFIFPGKGNKRNVASFILSLLIIALFVLLIILGLNYPPATVGDVELTGFEHFSLQIIRFLSIFFGMFAIIDGIFAFCSLADPDTYKPFSVIRGIFGIVLGILMCVFPVVLWAVGCYLSAAYIFIVSIVMIVVASKTIHNANQAKKAGVNVSATVIEAHKEKEDKKE